MDALITTLAQFHFIRPLWLLMLIPAAITGYLLWKRQTQSGSWQKVIPQELLRHLMPVKPVGASRWPLTAPDSRLDGWRNCFGRANLAANLDTG